MSAIPRTQRYTVDEYFELDQNSETRYEYVYGYVVAMAGASPEHELIVANIITALKNQDRKAGQCKVFASNLRTEIKKNGRYAYPDVNIVCGERQMGANKTLLNPTVVFEVLSSSTKAYDLSDKGDDYRRISSLQEIVYVYQDQPRVTHIFRQGDQWIIRDYDTTKDMFELPSIGCKLNFSEIYADVEFTALSDGESEDET